MSLLLQTEELRRNFASLPALAYFNSGSYGLLSNGVRKAYETYVDDRVAAGANWERWLQGLYVVREQVASVFGVDSDEIAIVSSASAALNAIASAHDFVCERCRIVVSDSDFPTGAQIWHAQELRGAIVTHVPEEPDGTLSMDGFRAAIDSRTAIVALSHVCYRTGAKLSDASICQIVELAHSVGAVVILDCYQSAGTELISPRALGVDICVGGMLKYLLGSAGVGYLYVRRGLIDQLVPRNTGWFAQEDIEAMNIFANEPSATARRFEAGTPAVPCLQATEAGLGLILEIGIEAVEEHVRTVTRMALDRFLAEGFPVVTPLDGTCRGPLLALKSHSGHALVAALADAKVVVSTRGGNVRAGFHFYTDETDLERLVVALRQHRGLLD